MHTELSILNWGSKQLKIKCKIMGFGFLKWELKENVTMEPVDIQKCSLPYLITVQKTSKAGSYCLLFSPHHQPHLYKLSIQLMPNL